jgi:hypothetical protein
MTYVNRQYMRGEYKTLGRCCLPLRCSPGVYEEDPGTIKSRIKREKSGRDSSTFVMTGVDIGSVSGSQSYPSGSGEGPAAVLERLGNILEVRATRNPRMNTH